MFDDNQITPRGFTDFALGMTVNATLVDIPLPMLDIGHCMRSDPATTASAVHNIQLCLRANNSPVPLIQSQYNDQYLVLSTATAQRALENALVQLEAVSTAVDEDVKATLELKRAAAKAIQICSVVSSSQTESKNSFLTALEQHMFGVSQDIASLIAEKLRDNSDMLLDQLVDERTRADAANTIRPKLVEHEADVKDLVGKALNTSAAAYLSALVSERMNQLAVDVITQLTSQSLDNMQAILQHRRQHPKGSGEPASKAKDLVGSIKPALAKDPSQPTVVLTPAVNASTALSAEAASSTSAEAPAQSDSTWRNSRIRFTADHDEDEIRAEAPLDLSIRATDQRNKATKPLVHLTKDRPKMQVCFSFCFCIKSLL